MKKLIIMSWVLSLQMIAVSLELDAIIKNKLNRLRGLDTRVVAYGQHNLEIVMNRKLSKNERRDLKSEVIQDIESKKLLLIAAYSSKGITAEQLKNAMIMMRDECQHSFTTQELQDVFPEV